jgi:hypothetical protein
LAKQIISLVPISHYQNISGTYSPYSEDDEQYHHSHFELSTNVPVNSYVFEFIHEGIRNNIYNQMSPKARRAAHKCVAQYYVSQLASILDDKSLLTNIQLQLIIARQYLLANERDLAAFYYVLAIQEVINIFYSL